MAAWRTRGRARDKDGLRPTGVAHATRSVGQIQHHIGSRDQQKYTTHFGAPEQPNTKNVGMGVRQYQRGGKKKRVDVCGCDASEFCALKMLVVQQAGRRGTARRDARCRMKGWAAPGEQRNPPKLHPRSIGRLGDAKNGTDREKSRWDVWLVVGRVWHRLPTQI